MKHSLVHLNGDQLISLWIETTGDEPQYHEIIHIGARVVQSDWENMPGVPPIDCLMRPNHPRREQRLSSKTAQAIAYGLTQETGFNLFCDWFDRVRANLRMKDGKKFVPIVTNICKTLGHLRAWFGGTFEHFFQVDGIRDTLTIAHFFNDYSDWCNTNAPFPLAKRLTGFAKRLGIEYEPTLREDALYMSDLQRKVYKKMLLNLRQVHIGGAA